jgi:D-3-phosphoglycerate dehydrogenase
MKVVVTDYEYPNLEPEKDAFQNMRDLELADSKCKNEDEIIAACKDADGILNQWNHIPSHVIDSLERCKVIATYGIGVDKIDVESATKKGIYVCNSPDYNKFEVADHVVMMILALSRQVVQLDHLMHEGKYGWYYLKNKLYRPANQIVGFVGFGRIAKQIAEKIRAFGMRSVCYDPFLTAEQCAAAGAKKMDLDEMMKCADFVSINVSLSKQTYHMINAHHLSLMKPSAYLVNCSRGAIVDEQALIDVLKNRKIAGAGLDTFETEPILPGHPLLEMDNVIVTPHSAWYTQQSIREVQWGAAHQVALVLEGKKPTHVVNYEGVQEVLKNR